MSLSRLAMSLYKDKKLVSHKISKSYDVYNRPLYITI